MDTEAGRPAAAGAWLVADAGGPVILITGGSRGVGAATARRYSRHSPASRN